MGPNHPPHRKRQCLPQLPSHATARPKVQTSSICFSTGASTRPRESQDQCRSVSELLHMRFFIQHTGIILGNSTCNKIPALDLWGLTHATIASVPGRPVQSFLAFSFSFTSSQQKRSSVWIKSHGQCKIWDFLQLHYCQVDIHCHHPACLACLAYLACLACLACRHMPCHTAYHCRMVCHMHATPWSAWSSRLATWTGLESVVSSGSSGHRHPSVFGDVSVLFWKVSTGFFRSIHPISGNGPKCLRMLHPPFKH